MNNEIAARHESGLMPTSIGDKMSMAEVLSKSGIMPQSLNTAQKVFVALQMGHELGVPPMVAVNNIAAVNGKPVISADLQVAVARQHPEFGGMDVRGDAQGCTVTVRRASQRGTETFAATFSMDDAQRAGLLSKDNWKKYPARMLKHRATAFALRDAFPDALAGFYTGDEIQTAEPSEVHTESSESEITVTSSEPVADETQPDEEILAARAEAIAAAKLKKAAGAITDETRRQWWDEIASAKTSKDLRGVTKRIEALPEPKPEPNDSEDLDGEAEVGWDEASDKQQTVL